MTTTKDWEAEFDEKLYAENGWGKELGNGDDDWSSVKDFIRYLLLAQKNELKGVVEGTKHVANPYRELSDMGVQALVSRNKALDEVLAALDV